MKDYEIIKLVERCVAGECVDCPYTTADCSEVLERILELAKRQKAQLEQPTTACDHEIIAQSHSEEIRKLHDKLCEAEIAHERIQRELSEAQKELAYLRAIKATTEAFLGVKIDGQM